MGTSTVTTKQGVGAAKKSPPKAAKALVRCTQFGKHRAEYVPDFIENYIIQVERLGEFKARVWAYEYAAKAVFFVAFLAFQAIFFAALARVKRIARVARR